MQNTGKIKSGCGYDLNSIWGEGGNVIEKKGGLFFQSKFLADAYRWCQTEIIAGNDKSCSGMNFFKTKMGQRISNKRSFASLGS